MFLAAILIGLQIWKFIMYYLNCRSIFFACFVIKYVTSKAGHVFARIRQYGGREYLFFIKWKVIRHDDRH